MKNILSAGAQENPVFEKDLQVIDFNAPLAVLDLETTGLSKIKDRIIEIGIVFFDTHFNFENEYVTFLNPEQESGAAFIHGITDKDLCKAPVFSQVEQELASLLKDRIIVAHNAAFDIRFLNAEFARTGSTFRLRLKNSVCTLDQSRIYCEPGSHALGKLVKRLGFQPRHQHRALDDARSAADLLGFYLQMECRGKRFANISSDHDGKRVFPSDFIVQACAQKLW